MYLTLVFTLFGVITERSATSPCTLDATDLVDSIMSCGCTSNDDCSGIESQFYTLLTSDYQTLDGLDGDSVRCDTRYCSLTCTEGAQVCDFASDLNGTTVVLTCETTTDPNLPMCRAPCTLDATNIADSIMNCACTSDDDCSGIRSEFDTLLASDQTLDGLDGDSVRCDTDEAHCSLTCTEGPNMCDYVSDLSNGIAVDLTCETTTDPDFPVCRDRETSTTTEEPASCTLDATNIADSIMNCACTSDDDCSDIQSQFETLVTSDQTLYDNLGGEGVLCDTGEGHCSLTCTEGPNMCDYVSDLSNGIAVDLTCEATTDPDFPVCRDRETTTEEPAPETTDEVLESTKEDTTRSAATQASYVGAIMVVMTILSYI
eukprot:165580_1